ncbi:MAG: histidine kinase dimerization/phospho-acceptor domain-containing protein, partial [Calditrichaceae bacterium]
MKNILNKKLFYILYFALFVSILLSVYLYDVLKYNLFDEIEAELDKKIAITRAHMDIDAFEHKNSSQLKAYADEIRKNSGLRTTMIDKIGYVLADSDVPLARLDSVENHLFRKEVQEALRTGRGLAVRTSATINKRLLYYCETVKKQGRVIGFIRLAMFAPEIDARMDFIWALIWKMSILFIVSITIAAVILTILYNRSQYSIAKDVLKQRQKKKFRPLSDQGREEFHQIITAFNRYGNKVHRKIYKTKEKRKRLGFLYDYLNEGIALFDENNQVLFFNKAFLDILKIKENSSFNEPFYYWLHFPPLVQDIENIQEAHKHIRRKIKYHGDTFIEYELIPTTELPDSLAGSFILKVRDITKIQQSEEMRQEFVTNASHELNTPLSSINGYLETLISGKVKDKKKEEEFLGKIKNQTSLLINLVRDLNDLSKSDNEFIDSKT